MKKNRLHAHTIKDRKGFTLIEIIVALVLIGMTGALMFPALRTGLAKSATPVKRVGDQYELIQEMDRLNAAYRHEIGQDSADDDTDDFSLDDFKTNFVDIAANIDAANTYYLTCAVTSGNTVQTSSCTQSGTATSLLMVTMSKDNMTLVALFSQ